MVTPLQRSRPMGAQIDPLPSPASLGQALGQADAATHAGDVTTPASAVAGESPPVPSAAKGGSVDPSSVSERELARLPHNHSWRWSPPVYTAASCLIFLLFFVQPHSWRVRLYSSLRSLVDDERQFYTLGSLTVHTLSFAALNGGMALIYWAGLPFFEQFKIESKPWPWHRGPKERAQYFALVRKTLALISFNLYFLQPILLWVGYRDGKRMGMGGDPSPEAVPAWYTSMWQIAVCMLVEDTLFYWSHRMLHWPRIYGYVHKVKLSAARPLVLACSLALLHLLLTDDCASLSPFVLVFPGASPVQDVHRLGERVRAPDRVHCEQRDSLHRRPAAAGRALLDLVAVDDPAAGRDGRRTLRL